MVLEIHIARNKQGPEQLHNYVDSRRLGRLIRIADICLHLYTYMSLGLQIISLCIRFFQYAIDPCPLHFWATLPEGQLIVLFGGQSKLHKRHSTPKFLNHTWLVYIHLVYQRLVYIHLVYQQYSIYTSVYISQHPTVNAAIIKREIELTTMDFQFLKCVSLFARIDLFGNKQDT